ncbi:hypothetical protein pb186bvf_005967 [Paramecium bursaria]
MVLRAYQYILIQPSFTKLMGSSATKKAQPKIITPPSRLITEGDMNIESSSYNQKLGKSSENCKDGSVTSSLLYGPKILRFNIPEKIVHENEIVKKFQKGSLDVSVELRKLIANIDKKLGTYSPPKWLRTIFKSLQKFGPMIVNKNAIYIGQWSQGYQTGFGEIYDKNQTYYIGYFFMNKFHGHGRLIYEDGDCYEGEWYLGKPIPNGTFYNYNGTVMQTLHKPTAQQMRMENPSLIENGDLSYYGKIDRNHKTGYGLQEYADGSYYLGNFEADQRQELGEMTYSNGENYFGGFRDNIYHEVGYQKWNNGKFYFGKFKKGQKHGYGILRSQDQIQYEGFFIDGKMHGKGSIQDLKTGVIEFGFWENGVKLSTADAKKKGLDQQL